MSRIFVNGSEVHVSDVDDEIIVQDDWVSNMKVSGWCIFAVIVLGILLIAPYFVTLVYLVIHCPVAAIIHFLFTLLLFYKS